MPAFNLLTLPDLLRAEMIAHAHSAAPNECCGVLAGVVREGVAVACVRFPVGNDAASPTEYLSNPKDMLAAVRAIREKKLDLLAVYHSHPTSEPVPSRRDVDRNAYGDEVVHLIVSLAGPIPEVRGWWLGRKGVMPAALASA